MFVLDANVWVHALVDAGSRGDAARSALTVDPGIVVPAHAPVEVLRTLSRLERGGHLDARRATELARHAIDLTVRVVAPEPWLLDEVWALRHNVSAYDAPYLAIARRLDLTLLTSDQRLARAAERVSVAVRLIT